MPDENSRYYLAYTDEKDWSSFITGTQTTFGFGSHHKQRADEVLPGDLLICYLKGKSEWCGVLRVAASVDLPDGTSGELIATYPIRIPVERVALLPTYQAISIKDEQVWNRLSFTRWQTPSQGWMTRAGLRQDLKELPREDGEFLLREIRERIGSPLQADAAGDASYDPTLHIDDREWVNRQIVARRGQQRFRDQLIEMYGACCAISGCTIPDVLEAAHVTRYLGQRTNHVSNGLLLRADLHTLFDCGLLAIHPVTRKVMLAPQLHGSEYQVLDGKTLQEPYLRRSAPSKNALQGHLDSVFTTTRHKSDGSQRLE